MSQNGTRVQIQSWLSGSVIALLPYQRCMSGHNSCLKSEMEFKFIKSGLPCGIWSYLLSSTMDPAQIAYQHALRQCQALQNMACLFTLFIRVIVLNVAAIIWAQYMKQPWHTSMLTGQMWVLELLAGHPEHSRTQLGVHSHVFYAIIDELHALGYTDSKFVTNNWPSFYIALLLAWQLGTLESDSKDLMILLHCKQFFILTAFS